MVREDQNKALVPGFYEEIDAGNIDAMDDLVADDDENHNPAPFPGLEPGLNGLKQAFRPKATRSSRGSTSRVDSSVNWPASRQRARRRPLRRSPSTGSRTA
jgi:hypothetical protein